MLQPMPERTVAVVGLGKIGLPLAAQFARKGMRVTGCDVLDDVVEAVSAGRSHIREEPGLGEAVKAGVEAGQLRATRDTTAAVKEAGVVVVIVPLVVSPGGDTDFRNLDAATAAVGRGLQKGAVVIYETTVPVGTTRRRLAPMLEKESGLRAGVDFHLAFSPERLYSGRIFEDLRKYPKIVGGIDAGSTAAAVAFYEAVLDAEVWPVENTETAEFAKLAETTYRDVNIALANQLAMYAASRDVNVSEAFHAANSQPFSHIHRPSIGVGGHCIPVYPHFLLGDATNGELSLVRDGRSTNQGMAEVGVRQLEAVLGGLRGRRVLVLGAAYREDVKELAFSSVFPVVELLHRAGAHVMVHDPLYRPDELRMLEAEVVEDLDPVYESGVDAVVVQAWHREFRDLDWRRIKGLKVVLDGRGTLDAAAVRRAGAAYIAIGISETRAGTPK
jgi:nucleotide sugar dehydrogenase